MHSLSSKLTRRLGKHSASTPSQRDSLVVLPGLGARRAEVAAPSAFEVRDALAPCRVLARLFALIEARDNSRRALRHLYLTSFRVTLDLRTKLLPNTYCTCGDREPASQVWRLLGHGKMFRLGY